MNNKDINTAIKIIRKKGDVCPICGHEMFGKNYWVKYHVRYGEKPIIILGCRFCNYTEWLLRNGGVDRVRCATPTRVFAIKSFHYKFGVIL